MNIVKEQFTNYCRKRHLFEYQGKRTPLTPESYSGRLLYKSSGFRGQWKLRFFQLRGNILFHYENQSDEVAANISFLEDVMVETTKELLQMTVQQKYRFGFRITYQNPSNSHISYIQRWPLYISTPHAKRSE